MTNKIIKGLIILIALLLIGYIIFLKLPKASVGSRTVVAEMTAGDIYQEFMTNEQVAQQQYLGKAVIVSGTIDDMYEDETNAPVVILKDEDGTPVALVTLEMGEKKKLADYKVDDQLRVKALCSGLLMEVTLNKGIILD